MSTTAADSPFQYPYSFGSSANPIWEVPLTAKPVEDDDLDEGALIQVDNARVLGTALRRFIETSGVDDPYVLANVLDYIK